MQALIGAPWQEWEAEQCASNFAAAKSAGTVLLPNPAYTKCFLGFLGKAPHFLHFAERVRFEDGFFVGHARQEIATPAKGGRRG